jgi:ABC-type transport system involved in multi-copper enzyme maturation permease subunit
MYNLFTKTLYDKRAFIIGWGLGMVVLGFLMMSFYPAFHQDTGLDQLVRNLPAAFQGLIGNLNNLKELPSYIGSQLFEVRIPIFVSMIAIILTVGLTVGEEEKGQLRMLLAMPLSRVHILLSKWLAVVTIGFLTTVAVIVGMLLGLIAIHETLDVAVIVRLGLMTWLLTVCLATVVFSVGLASGRRGLTMGAGVLLAAGSFILTTFAKSVEWLQPYEVASLLHYFPATDIAKTGISLSDVAVFVVIIIVTLGLSIVLFRRRDVR